MCYSLSVVSLLYVVDHGQPSYIISPSPHHSFIPSYINPLNSSLSLKFPNPLCHISLAKSRLQPIINEEYQCTTWDSPRDCNPTTSIQPFQPLRIIHRSQSSYKGRPRLSSRPRPQLCLCLHGTLRSISREHCKVIQDTGKSS